MVCGELPAQASGAAVCGHAHGHSLPVADHQFPAGRSRRLFKLHYVLSSPKVRFFYGGQAIWNYICNLIVFLKPVSPFLV